MAAGVLLVPGVLTDTIVLLAYLHLWLKPDESQARRQLPTARY